MKLTRILPFIIPIVLTACADNTVSESISVSDSLPITETAAPESAESDSSDASTTDSTETNSDTDYIGICGEVFEPEMFKEDPDAVLNMYLYYRTDYGYTALFDGRTYNSYNDPEKFDLENWECTERCEAASGGYFIINKGDKIGSLTCTDAFAEYYVNDVSPLNDAFGLMSSSVCFEGEIEVTGYIDRYDGDEGYVEEGELHFYPDGESWQGLPVEYDSFYWTYSLKDGTLVYAPFRLSLGVISDYSALDLERDIPQGSTAHMKLVLKDLQLNYVNNNFGNYTISTATIVSAEKID